MTFEELEAQGEALLKESKRMLAAARKIPRLSAADKAAADKVAIAAYKRNLTARNLRSAAPQDQEDGPIPQKTPTQK
jgi:hypothetical protein